MEALLKNFHLSDILGYLFVVILVIVAFKKILYPRRFYEYIQLLFNNKYALIYAKKEKIIHLFTLLGITIHIIFISIYIWGLFYVIYPERKVSLLASVEFSVLFYLSKMILQYIIAFVFNISALFYHYSFVRKSYNNYGALIGFCIIMVSVYGFNSVEAGLILSTISYLFIYVLGLLQIIKSLRREVFKYLFYFILYLCTLEVIPCVIVGLFIIKAT